MPTTLKASKAKHLILPRRNTKSSIWPEHYMDSEEEEYEPDYVALARKAGYSEEQIEEWFGPQEPIKLTKPTIPYKFDEFEDVPF